MLIPSPDRPSSSIKDDSNSNSSNNKHISDKLDALEIVEAIFKRCKLIIQVTILAAIISLGVTFLLDNVYSATALILPPQQDSGLLAMLMGNSGSNLASLAGDIIGKGTPADMYVGILNSDAISDPIIDRFKLISEYNEKYRVTTYKVLKKKVKIGVGKKDGIISITVEDKDPKQAAEMANAYVEELGKLIIKINKSDSTNNKIFFEQRLAKAKKELISAENNFKAFQAKNKIISVTEQAQTTIASIAQLKAQLALQDVQLAVLQQHFTDGSQEVKTAKSSIKNLYAQIARLEGKGLSGAIPNVGSVPELGQQYLRLMRELKIQETLVELLTKNYEIEKLNSAKDYNLLQIIQPARTPDKKSWPKRAFIIAATTASAFIFSVLFVLITISFDSMLPEQRARWLRLIKFQS